MSADETLATATVQEDNELTRVVRWHFKPGEATGWHTHERDYVIVPTIGGTVTMVESDGTETSSEIVASESYFRRAGVHHNVVNRTGAPVEFVEIEFK